MNFQNRAHIYTDRQGVSHPLIYQKDIIFDNYYINSQNRAYIYIDCQILK